MAPFFCSFKNFGRILKILGASAIYFMRLHTLLGGFNVSDELFFEVGDLFWLDFIEMTSDTAVDDTDLHGDIHWLILVLF